VLRLQTAQLLRPQKQEKSGAETGAKEILSVVQKTNLA